MESPNSGSKIVAVGLLGIRQISNERANSIIQFDLIMRGSIQLAGKKSRDNESYVNGPTYLVQSIP